MSDYYKMVDTISRIAFCSWCSTSLGLPWLTTIYINKLGKTVGLECVDENFTIVNKYPNKNQNLKQSFVDDLKTATLFPLVMILGPFSIPLSIALCIKATINYLRYKS